MTTAQPGQGDTRGTGTNTMQEIEGDPRGNSRKSILARYNASTQAEREIDNEQVPGAREMQSGYDQGETADTEDGDTTGEGAIQHQRAAEVDAPPVEAPDPNEIITLKVFGQEIHKSRAEVDAAGGKDAMELVLAADYRLQQAGTLAQRAYEASQSAAETKRIYDQKLQEMRAQQGAQTQSTAPASGAHTPSQAAGGVDQDTVKHLVAELYSGSPERMEAAFSDVFSRMNARPAGSPEMTPKQIEELVQASVDKDRAAQRVYQADVDQVNSVNELMKGKYAHIMANPQIAKDCRDLYYAAEKDPRNQGRAKVLIADEVAGRVSAMMGIGPNADNPGEAEVQQEVATRTNFKRRIPQVSNATGRVPAAETVPAFPTKPSEIVNLLRAGRNQPIQR